MNMHTVVHTCTSISGRCIFHVYIYMTEPLKIGFVFVAALRLMQIVHLFVVLAPPRRNTQLSIYIYIYMCTCIHEPKLKDDQAQTKDPFAHRLLY